MTIARVVTAMPINQSSAFCTSCQPEFVNVTLAQQEDLRVRI